VSRRAASAWWMTSTRAAGSSRRRAARRSRAWWRTTRAVRPRLVVGFAGVSASTGCAVTVPSMKPRAAASAVTDPVAAAVCAVVGAHRARSRAPRPAVAAPANASVRRSFEDCRAWGTRGAFSGVARMDTSRAATAHPPPDLAYGTQSAATPQLRGKGRRVVVAAPRLHRTPTPRGSASRVSSVRRPPAALPLAPHPSRARSLGNRKSTERTYPDRTPSRILHRFPQ